MSTTKSDTKYNELVCYKTQFALFMLSRKHCCRRKKSQALEVNFLQTTPSDCFCTVFLFFSHFSVCIFSPLLLPSSSPFLFLSISHHLLFFHLGPIHSTIKLAFSQIRNCLCFLLQKSIFIQMSA